MASGTKTAIMAMVMIHAEMTGCVSVHTSLVTGAVGLPNSSRTAATMTLTGLIDANHCSASGIDSIGTNALLTNVSGKMITNAMPMTESGVRTIMPIHVPNQIMADANSSNNTNASTTWSALECVRQPISRPVPSK